MCEIQKSNYSKETSEKVLKKSEELVKKIIEVILQYHNPFSLKVELKQPLQNIVTGSK